MNVGPFREDCLVAPMIETPVDVPTEVAKLLALSRASHVAYQQEARKSDNPKAPTACLANYTVCEAHVKAALESRLAAAQLDPDRTSPAWQGEKASHEALVQFYVKYLRTP